VDERKPPRPRHHPDPRDRYDPPPQRGRYSSLHDDVPEQREQLASIHDVEEAKQELRDEFREEITASHIVAPEASKTTTSTPPAIRWLQKQLWNVTVTGLRFVAAGIGLALSVVITILVTSYVKDCQARHAVPATVHP
jgi:hypothetical protein